MISEIAAQHLNRPPLVGKGRGQGNGKGIEGGERNIGKGGKGRREGREGEGSEEEEREGKAGTRHTNPIVCFRHR